jgi:hypothetical protein
VVQVFGLGELRPPGWLPCSLAVQKIEERFLGSFGMTVLVTGSAALAGETKKNTGLKAGHCET